MFGHNDQQHHDTTLPAPVPDNDLTDDSQASADLSQANDTAGEFMDDVGSSSAPQVPGGLQDDNPAIAGTNLGGSSDRAAASKPNTDVLLDIKQQALQQLTPLVDHLEQSPEEKFRTTMMMIQAADNHELIQAAYEAALQITDDKVRAQALLDIVNEINYFTQNNHSPES